jgi:hypothetical protein
MARFDARLLFSCHAAVQATYFAADGERRARACQPRRGELTSLFHWAASLVFTAHTD